MNLLSLITILKWFKFKEPSAGHRACAGDHVTQLDLRFIWSNFWADLLNIYWAHVILFFLCVCLFQLKLHVQADRQVLLIGWRHEPHRSVPAFVLFVCLFLTFFQWIIDYWWWFELFVSMSRKKQHVTCTRPEHSEGIHDVCLRDFNALINFNAAALSQQVF